MEVPNVEVQLRELAKLVGGDVSGDINTVINGIRGIREAGPGDITFAASAHYRGFIWDTQASAIVVGRELDVADVRKPLIRVDNPDIAFSVIVEYFAPNHYEQERGIHPTAVIGKQVRLGHNVSIRALSVIEDYCEIGDDSVIHPQVFVGHHTKIGRNCLIYAGVRIREHILMGDRVIIHSNAVIGSDGFGFSTVKGVHHKIAQIGTVEIEDDVEIGAGCTIDRARFDKTHIGKGTKIDNLVQIAHNAWIGERCRIVAQTGIAGSTKLGHNVTMAGQSGVTGHVEIGDNTVVAARAGVTKDIPPESCVSGFPAIPIERDRRQQISVRRLPELCREIKELKERIRQLEEQSKNDRPSS